MKINIDHDAKKRFDEVSIGSFFSYMGTIYLKLNNNDLDNVFVLDEEQSYLGSFERYERIDRIFEEITLR